MLHSINKETGRFSKKQKAEPFLQKAGGNNVSSRFFVYKL